ncbi:hypothetical protein [Bradyrhizobium sp. USDA 4454]
MQRLRAQIANLINERSRIERSESTTKEKKAKVASFVKELAAKGTPRIFVGHNRVSVEFGRGVTGELDPPPLEVLSWIDPALVIERLEAAIDAEHKSPNQMSVTDRDQRLAEIKLELHEAERQAVQQHSRSGQ